MSDPRAADLHDPKYGKVHELCKKLGYASDRKGTPRWMHFLSLRTTSFRKKFVESVPGILHFPLEYESAEAQSCASNFINRNSLLFEDSIDAQAFGWPVLPRDEEMFVYDQRMFPLSANFGARLKQNLAKLMCTQEYLYRRNVNYAESREKVFYLAKVFREVLIRKREREETEDNTLDTSDSESSGISEAPSDPTASRRNGATDKPGTFKRVDRTKEEREAR
jgi:hypothetical protein